MALIFAVSGESKKLLCDHGVIVLERWRVIHAHRLRNGHFCLVFPTKSIGAYGFLGARCGELALLPGCSAQWPNAWASWPDTVTEAWFRWVLGTMAGRLHVMAQHNSHGLVSWPFSSMARGLCFVAPAHLPGPGFLGRLDNRPGTCASWPQNNCQDLVFLGAWLNS